jgi:hypothetical protein
VPEPGDNRNAGQQCASNGPDCAVSIHHIGRIKQGSSEHNAARRYCVSDDEATVPISSGHGGSTENNRAPRGRSDHGSAHSFCGG